MSETKKVLVLEALLRNGEIVTHHIDGTPGATLNEEALDKFFDPKALGSYETYFGRDAITGRFFMLRIGDVSAMSGRLMDLPA